MRHGSLFSGIGGFDLAAQWMGWENIFNCDIDPFCQKVLKYHFPDATQYSDIKTTDFTIWRGRVDILTGGFPCQPFSAAGKRRGTEDDRHLWPEMLRAVRKIRPRWVVGENVHGIVNWSGGLVFEQVQADLEAEGYQVQAYVLPACAVNAPHRRDRVWFVAHRSGESIQQGIGREWEKCFGEGRTVRGINSAISESRTTSHTDSDGFNGSDSEYKKHTGQGGVNALDDLEHDVTSHSTGTGLEGGNRLKESVRPEQGNSEAPADTNNELLQGRGCEARPEKARRHPGALFCIPAWDNFPTQSPVRYRDDGLPLELAAITFPKWRIESIKAMGNAIVPQVAYQIFKTIKDYEIKEELYARNNRS